MIHWWHTPVVVVILMSINLLAFCPTEIYSDRQRIDMMNETKKNLNAIENEQNLFRKFNCNSEMKTNRWRVKKKKVDSYTDDRSV